MTWKAGINSVLSTFALLCVLQLAPLASGGVLEISTVRLLVAALGLFFAIGAWRRDFWGFIGVLAVCATAAAFDVLLVAAKGTVDPILVLNALFYSAVGAALYTARREFRRGP